MFEEVLALFPSEFVHIGGDECPKDQWRRSPAAQARIKELGLADEDELQSWFVRHFDRWLTERGRRLIGWDEILEGGLADGAAVSSWRGYAGGIAAARAGHDVVMCPEQHVYLDHRQDAGADEPVPIGYVRTLEDVYRFEPVPPALTPREARHVLGTQANLWTEVMEDPARVDYQAFPGSPPSPRSPGAPCRPRPHGTSPTSSAGWPPTTAGSTPSAWPTGRPPDRGRGSAAPACSAARSTAPRPTGRRSRPTARDPAERTGSNKPETTPRSSPKSANPYGIGEPRRCRAKTDHLADEVGECP